MVKLPLQCNERGIYMFWFLGVLAGLLLSVADIFLLTRKRNAPACIIAVLRDTLVSNLASLGIMSLILRIPNVLLTSVHGKWYPLKYFVFVLAVGLVFLFGRGVVEGVISFSHTKPKHKVGAWILRILSMLFAALGMAAFTASIWAADTFAGLTPDQMMINLNSDTGRRKPRGYEYAVPRSCFAYGCGNSSVLRICFFNEKNLVQASRKTAHRIFGTCKTSHGSFLGTSYAFRRRGVRYKKAFSSKALCGLC